MSCVDGQLWAVRWSPSQASVSLDLYIAPLAAGARGKDGVHSPLGKYTSSMWTAYRKPLGSPYRVPIGTLIPR